MPPEGQAELAHPEAADWMLGNLSTAAAVNFQLHLASCPHCQAAVAEFAAVGQMLQQLPPPAEPPPELEERTIARVLAAQARAEPQPRRVPAAPLAAEDNRTATQVYQRPGRGAAQAEEGTGARIVRFPQWRSRGGLLAVATVAAAVVAAAVIVPLSLGGSQITPAPTTVAIPLHATTTAKLRGYGAATGRAVARQAGESWTFDLTVHGLKPLPGNDFYECWWAAPGSTKLHPALATGGSFVVGKSGSATLTMTTGVDPRQFRTMVITAESPGSGALHGPVLLTGRSAAT